MNYNLEDIRFELSYNDDITAYEDDYMSVTLLLEAVSSDIAIENKLIDTLKSGINSFKKFFKMVSNWFRYMVGKARRRIVKLTSSMLKLRETLYRIISSIRRNNKNGNESATEDYDSTLENDPRVQKVVEAVNTMVSITMAQYLIGWKMMSYGEIKGNKLNFGNKFLAVATIFLGAFCPFMILVGIGYLFMTSFMYDPNVRNIDAEESLEKNVFELLGVIISYQGVQKVLNRVSPYTIRVNKIMDIVGKNEDIRVIVNEILSIKDWVTLEDIYTNMGDKIKNISRGFSNDVYQEYVDNATRELDELVAQQPDDDRYWAEEDILRNMRIMQESCSWLYQISLIFQHAIDSEITTLRKPMFAQWHASSTLSGKRIKFTVKTTYDEYLDRKNNKSEDID